MKISFETAAPAAAEQNTISYMPADDSRESMVSKTGYRLDISGIVKDNRAYEGQGKTGEDVCTQHVQVSRQDMANARNYMTVMSNSLSAEDYGKMMENGEEPSYMEAGAASTIIDAVKVAVLKSGKNIEGYTTDIDKETLEKITGSQTYANELTDSFAKYDVPVTRENAEKASDAAKLAEQIEPLQDGAVRYMVANGMEPTISNLYEAQYSASGDGTDQPMGYYASDAQGYYAQKADEYNWDQLKPQMDKVILGAGLENSTDTQDECRWLIAKGIPLTSDSLTLLDQINETCLPADIGNVYDAAAAAISDGNDAADGNLSDTRSMLKKSMDYIGQAGTITDKAVEKTVSEGTTLTLRTLTAAQRSIDAYLDMQQPGTGYKDDKSGTDNVERSSQSSADRIKASEMTLASVRLQMTVKTNLILLRSGYSIDTVPIETLAEDLKSAGTDVMKQMFGNATEGELNVKNVMYGDALNVSSALGGMPAALLGRYSVTDADFTLQGAYDSGLKLQKQYEQAGQAYETVGTAPRADLGDSITKAFSSTDTLLKEIGLETSADNERAVRILGYNSMEITGENVSRVRTADMTMRDVIRKMTPAAALETVRAGIDPLKMNMGELESYLGNSEQNEQQEQTQFGKFIYSMDVSGKITDDERTSCIGIYRLFRQIENGGDAAVGAVLESGAEMTFGNLLTAVRSSRAGRLDYSVDDSFGGVDGVRQNVSITEQIRAAFSDGAQNDSGSGKRSDDTEQDNSDRNRYYKALASDVLSKMSPQKILETAPKSDTLITEFADQMREMQEQTETDSSYTALKMQELQGAHTDANSVDEIFTYALPMTINIMSGMHELRHNRGNWYRTISDMAESDSSDDDRRESRSFADAFTDRDSVSGLMESMTGRMQKTVTDAMESTSIGYVDLKLLQSCSTQLGVIRKLSDDENYEIPVEINGEKTSIHLKMVHGQEIKGQVCVTMETESTGRIAAQMNVNENTVSGYIACSDRKTADMINGSKGQITGDMDGKLDVITSDGLSLDTFERESDAAYRKNSTGERAAGNAADNRMLYRLAGAFIRTVTGGMI